MRAYLVRYDVADTNLRNWSSHFASNSKMNLLPLDSLVPLTAMVVSFVISVGLYAFFRLREASIESAAV